MASGTWHRVARAWACSYLVEIPNHNSAPVGQSIALEAEQGVQGDPALRGWC